MKSVRTHLAETHQEAADFHTKMAKSHYAIAKCMTKGSGDGFQKDVAAEHENMAQHHENAAAYHVDNCKAMKAADVEFSKRLVPDNISSVASSNAPSEAFGIRAIPRPGQPDPNLEKAAVPPEFRHLVEISEE
jgi:hypothetical protein